MINLRSAKGENMPAQKGQGAVYTIPADDLPSGLVSGEKMKVIIEGLVNIDEQGATIDVDRIYAEKLDQPKTDPGQDAIERGLKIDLSVQQ